MRPSETVLEEIEALRLAVRRLEAERDCAAVLARYGYYYDHGRFDDWVALFTPDGAIDVLMYYGEDILQPDPDNWRQTRFEGHNRLRELVTSGATASIVGRSQHQMGGPPATFQLVDGHTAVMATYSVVYVKDLKDPRPTIQYQNHAMNRWLFHRIDGRWLIAENVRRGLGDPGTAALVYGF